MGVNKDLPHLLVLPEDDANRQVANGFQKSLRLNLRKMQILPTAGGWREVLKVFGSDHTVKMNRHPQRFMILLIDLDGRERRVDEAVEQIPAELRDRVFILGALNELETLKGKGLGSYEAIGQRLAEECSKNEYTKNGWDHAELRHNSKEIRRMRDQIRAFLFA